MCLFLIDRFKGFAVFLHHFHAQLIFFIRQQCVDLPVLFRYKRFDFALALNNQTHRDRLHTTGG